MYAYKKLWEAASDAFVLQSNFRELEEFQAMGKKKSEFGKENDLFIRDQKEALFIQRGSVVQIHCYAK